MSYNVCPVNTSSLNAICSFRRQLIIDELLNNLPVTAAPRRGIAIHVPQAPFTPVNTGITVVLTLNGQRYQHQHDTDDKFVLVNITNVVSSNLDVNISNVKLEES